MKATINSDKYGWYAFIEYEEIYGKIMYRDNSISDVENKLLAEGYIKNFDAYYK